MRIVLSAICFAATFSIAAAPAGSCSEYNSSYYCDNGKVYSHYNHSLYDEQGKAWSVYGSSVYAPDSESYSEYGNALYDRKGRAWSSYGNTIYQPDGSSCSWYANTLYCQSTPGSKGNSIPQDPRAAILLQPELNKTDNN
jgi:hypothetical protein